MLDLSIFKDSKGPICVRCRDEKSTLFFLEEMMSQYPEKCVYWKPGESKWRGEDSEYIDYFPYLNGLDGNTLCWDDEDYAEKNGYIIIEYYDIPGALGPPDDFGEIDTMDIDISILF